MGKIELLAPAGDFDCFRAAVNAGADAVYLGGEKFGARAYAGNFSEGEIVDAIHIAHMFDRKVYLTVNTLVKESEFAELVPYIAPLYEAGLDGAIVQDVGVLGLLRSTFSDMELHASTQMAVTGSYGAAYMKELGVCRVVPARELSLDEIRDIKDRTGLEIECFIHGAMCYAYSGQCLFSSFLGGRSGNRGRCAGPCRLPYADGRGRTVYPLSLKDMYTLPVLPELIDAGIDSLKIEGRMKSPEYVAGVTAVYRKYIDRYLAEPDRPYRVDAADEELLKGLYIRSDISKGYYHRHNGREMVTLGEPGYLGSSQEVLGRIRERYLAEDIRLPVNGHARIFAGEQAEFTLSCEKAAVTVTGATASPARNRPLEEDEIAKQLGKIGDTRFALESLRIETDHASFLPVKMLNELRRLACGKLEEALAEISTRALVRDEIMHENQKTKGVYLEQKAAKSGDGDADVPVHSLYPLVASAEQLKAIHGFSEIKTVYVSADIFLSGTKPERVLAQGKDYILVMPHILRKRSYRHLAVYKTLLDSGYFAGVMARNFEELAWVREQGFRGVVVTDYTLYAWNNAALDFYAEQADRVTLPLELNAHELDRLHAGKGLELVVYGYIPLMYSANCIRNTLERCAKDQPPYRLTDRYGNVFSVATNCTHCYNILYNTVPLSLHGQMDRIAKRKDMALRLDFSVEDAEQTKRVLEYYLHKESEFPFQAFTNGHYKRGVK